VPGGGPGQLRVELGLGQVVPPRRVVRVGDDGCPTPPPGRSEEGRRPTGFGLEGVDARRLVADLRPRRQEVAGLAGIRQPEVEPGLLEPYNLEQQFRIAEILF